MKAKNNYLIFVTGIFIGIILTGLITFLVVDNFKIFNLAKTDISDSNKNLSNQVEKQDEIDKENITEEGNNDKIYEENNSSSSGDTNNNTNKNVSEDDIVKYFKKLNNTVFSEENIKKYSNKAKQNFIKITDFIFYDTQIDGYTFNELSDNVKLKIMSIMIDIDNKMEQYFPDYKDIIKDNYNDIKGFVLSKYLETSNKICEEVGSDACNEAKKGLETLKDSFNLTFEILKALGKSGLENLKDWYEIFRVQNKIN